MARAIAFFPWWSIDSRIDMGPVRLIPYSHRKLPGNQPDAAQADIDAVISAYANRPRHQVKQATLLEVDDWKLGQDPDLTIVRLAAAREAVAFAALSKRRLFGGHYDYCCFDTFSLVIQNYVEGKANLFSYTTRRRDGGVNNLWSSNDFAFQRPLHVNNSIRWSLDESLVALLMGEVPPNWAEAVVEFNRANTDSRDVLPHVEMVMMKSAFEWLFEIGERADDFSNALDRCIADLPAQPNLDGPLREQWIRARPKAPRLIQAWAREFCDRRGASAHGALRGGSRFVWSEVSHLAFASMLFPLVFKKIAHDAGVFEMTATDRERLRRIEEYVLHEPMSFDEDDFEEYTPHPWTRIDRDIQLIEVAERAYSALDVAIQKV